MNHEFLTSNQVANLANGLDNSQPLSYEKWSKYANSTSRESYQLYVSEWIRAKKVSVTESTLKDRYKEMLEQFRVFFSSEDADEWYRLIDTNNETDLLLAVPYFARKLKEICLYYQAARTELANAVQKKQYKGIPQDIQLVVRQAVLNAIANRFNKNGVSVSFAVPELSSVEPVLTVELEELYDSDTYLGIDQASAPAEPTKEFYEQRGITDTLFERIMHDLILPFEKDSSLSAISDEDYESFLRKYVGIDQQQVITTTTLSSSKEEVIWNLEQGVNRFYFPSSRVPASQTDTSVIVPVPLSSVDVSRATASDTADTADKIYVTYGSVVEGAWLSDQTKEPQVYPTEVIFRPGITEFRFPYAGYGLSGADIEWTGARFSTNKGFQFLPKAVQQAVLDKYYSQPLESPRALSASIHDLALEQSGAFASKAFKTSDKVYIDTYGETTSNFKEVSSAWLYRFENTHIRIQENGTTKFTWPFDEFVETAQNFTQVCNPIPLSQLNQFHFTAGFTPTTSDVIVKQTLDGLTEVAWLSGTPLTVGSIKFPNQIGCSFIVEPGQTVGFIWTGPDDIPFSSVFKTVEHAPNCRFRTGDGNKQKAAACSCGATAYSPFGHSGNNYDANSQDADYIIVDDGSITDTLPTPSNWTDSSGKNYLTSPNFAWFRGTRWEQGSWVKSSDLKLPANLRHGKRYFYHRKARQGEDRPPLVTNYKYRYETVPSVWTDARIENGVIISTGVPSNMRLVPGDTISVIRKAQSTYAYLSAITIANENERRNTIWATYDVVTVQPLSAATPVLFSWPTVSLNLSANDTANQFPPFSVENLSAVLEWTITDPQGRTVTLSSQIASYTPAISGEHTISVRAQDKDYNIVTVTSIPSLSVIPATRSGIREISLSYPTPGFVLENTLTGWDYNTNRFARNNVVGAKPYWAKHTEETTLDGYLLNVQPKLSPLVVNHKDVFRYERMRSTMIWNYNLSAFDLDLAPVWKTLEVVTGTSPLMSATLVAPLTGQQAFAITQRPSAITLSNFKSGQPVQITYDAQQTFATTLSIDIAQTVVTTTSATDVIVAERPWNSIPNRYTAVVASMPNVNSNIRRKTKFDAPELLGSLIYVDEFVSRTPEASSWTGPYSSVAGGIGNTNSSQQTVSYDTSVEWLKEPFVASSIAGNPRKELTRTYQTFVGHAANDNFDLGFVTPNSLLTPWGGSDGSVWVDDLNKPASFSGVVNVSAWEATQLLKNSDKRLYEWGSDVYGNQYGVYKLSSLSPLEAELAVGDAWVKLESGRVYPANEALSSVYDAYNVPALSSIYHGLTSNKVKSIVPVFDTLFIELSSHLIIQKIDFDYETGTISGSPDDVTGITFGNDLPIIGLQDPTVKYYVYICGGSQSPLDPVGEAPLYLAQITTAPPFVASFVPANSAAYYSIEVLVTTSPVYYVPPAVDKTINSPAVKQLVPVVAYGNKIGAFALSLSTVGDFDSAPMTTWVFSASAIGFPENKFEKLMSNIWLYPESKTAYFATTTLSGTNPVISLFKYPLVGIDRRISLLYSEAFDTIDASTMLTQIKLASQHNDRSFMLVCSGIAAGKPFVMKQMIATNDGVTYTADNTIYNSAHTTLSTLTPPNLSSVFITDVIQVSANEQFSVYLPIEAPNTNNDVSWELVSPLSAGIFLESPGNLYGVVEAGIHYLTIVISNDYGSNTYGLSLSAT